jgi:hypothetical protein
MKRSHYLFTLAALCLQLVTKAQTLMYTTYNAPVYRHATDQRYSNHKSVLYAADIDLGLAKSLTGRSGDDIDLKKVFIGAVIGDLQKSGLQMAKDSGDLNVLYIIDNISVNAISNPTGFGNTTYSVEGSMREAIINRKGEPYLVRTINLSSQTQIKAEDHVSDDFSKLISNPKAQDAYAILIRTVRDYAFQREKQFADGYHTEEFILPYIYRAQKKYPELAMMDSLNEALVAGLKKKDVTDYTNFVKPYVTAYTDMLNKTYPKDYSAKPIKVASWSELSFLYYLAYDTTNLKKSLDTLQVYTSKFMGNKLDYDPRAPLMKELNEYYATQNYRKYPVDSFTGEVRSDIFSSQKLIDNSWVVTTKGDTVKGRLIMEQMKGSMVDLDAGKYIKFEVMEKGKPVSKTYKLSEITAFGVGAQKTYEIHKFKPSLVSGGSFNLDALRSKDYPFQVIYSSPKIKVLKENYWDTPTNSIVFIRPNESDVANQGKDWNKKRDEMMQQYFKDCPAMQSKLSGYDFKSDASYIQMATDYTNSCN